MFQGRRRGARKCQGNCSPQLRQHVDIEAQCWGSVRVDGRHGAAQQDRPGTADALAAAATSIKASMPRPAFTSKLSLPHRLKQHNANSSTTSVNSIPTSRQGSPKRTMSDIKPGLVLRANVIKVRVAVPRGGDEVRDIR